MTSAYSEKVITLLDSIRQEERAMSRDGLCLALRDELRPLLAGEQFCEHCELRWATIQQIVVAGTQEGQWLCVGCYEVTWRADASTVGASATAIRGPRCCRSYPPRRSTPSCWLTSGSTSRTLAAWSASCRRPSSMGAKRRNKQMFVARLDARRKYPPTSQPRKQPLPPRRNKK